MVKNIKASCSKEKLKELAEQGLGVRAIAKMIGRTPGAVSQRLKAMGIDMSGRGVKERQVRVASQDFTPVKQIEEINDYARQILRKLEDCIAGDQVDQKKAALALKAMKEIRGQIKLAVEMTQAFLDYEAEVLFRQTILEVIGDVAPEARSEIIRRLKSQGEIAKVIKLP